MSTTNSKTKKLPPGVTNVASDGTVSGLTIAELARQVGKELGVQRGMLSQAEGGTNGNWYRIAKLTDYSTSGLLILHHSWNSGSPGGLIIGFTCAPRGSESRRSLVQIAGDCRRITKMRMVYETSQISYLEVFVSPSAILSLRVQVIVNYGVVDLIENPTLVSAETSDDGNPLVCEFKTLNGSWGGKCLPFKRLHIRRSCRAEFAELLSSERRAA